MALFELPIRSDVPSYEFRVELEAVVYTLAFNWNDRMARWTMDIRDRDGLPIVTGIKLITGWLLTRQYKEESLPPGDFLMFDTGGEDKVADQHDLGERVVLSYQESTG